MRTSRLKMKLTHQRMTGRYETTPESVLDWLEEQLECRGIDAVVYTRYILSLLQDYDSDDEEELIPTITSRAVNGFCCEKGVRRQAGVKDSLKPVSTNKWKHRRYRTTCPDVHQDCWPHYQCYALNSDQERKLAVVQCLKSASEQEFGIESFVDELCAKLKNIKLLTESVTESAVSETTAETKTEKINANNNGVKESPKEQAMKYYAAFPALDHNCNEEAPPLSKPDTDNTPNHSLNRSAKDIKWNGQKIIEYMNGNNGLPSDLSSVVINLRIGEQKSDKLVESSETTVPTKPPPNGAFYCEDIESNVMDVPLVDNQSLESLVNDGIQEENDRFERLVNKFNENIASIWSTTGTDRLPVRTDNIWSFDSAFSSNQSSATPSPKSCAIDLWSALTLTQLEESLPERKGTPLESWTTSVFRASVGAKPQFFDEPDINWRSVGTDLVNKEINSTTLQNHQKNSPFIEFNAILSSNAKTWQRPQLADVLSIHSFLSESNSRLSPVVDENLLTSSKTHFEPIRQDSFERDDSDDESIPEIIDTEVNKLVICSDKCPNNSDAKADKSLENLRFRPISTSFGELASFMGPFNDFEFNGSEYLPTQSTESQMSDKSTNTESLCPEAMNKLPPIVEINAEPEPEYQDLYQMINEVLRNGLSEDSTPIGTTSLTLSDDCELNSALNDLSFNCSKSIDSLLSDPQMNGKQSISDLEPTSDFTVDELFGDELFYRNVDLCQQFTDFDEVFDDNLIGDNTFDSVYSASVCDYPTAGSLPTNKQIHFDSQLNLQYKRRHYKNVEPPSGQSSSRVRKPCSFFIEGNCKRSDCKYSHQISAITCKYWEEGFCFKAELCPFLHGYLDDANPDQTDCTSLESKSYAIESESDFPSLALNCAESEATNPLPSELEASADAFEHHFFDFQTKSVAQTNGTVGPSKAKLPIAVFMKKKLRKRKDRNLQ